MIDFINLWTSFLPLVTDFLMSEPIIYFVGMSIFLVIALIVKRIISI